MPDGVTVQQLCQRIEHTVTDAFSEEVWVNGAISGIKRSANGHVYFDLVQPNETGGAPTATLPIALFAKAKFRVNAILKRTNAIRMTDGVEVQIRGQVTYYPRQSRVQLIMTLIDPAYTLGQLETAKAQLLIALKAEGLLVANKRHQIPALPLRVALITSSGSAAEADFTNELQTSGINFDVTLFDSRVQGDEATGGLTKALTETGQTSFDAFDVIVVIRGGGARTDLVAFDHGDVARAIAGAKLPVIVGVGHEIDQSVADEVAHTSVKTPTAAAGVLIDKVQHFERRVTICADRIAHRTNDHLRQAELILGAYQARTGRSAAESLAQASGTLDRLSDRARQSSERATERAEAALERADLRIRAVDPALALARGWSITRIVVPHTEGSDKSTLTKRQLVRSFTDLEPGAVLETTLLEGTVTSTVTERLANPAPDAPLSQPPSQKR